MPESTEVRALSFRPRARIIRTIGDQLIAGPESAVIELVKNSHDADATFVRVKFIPPLDGPEGTIVVEDDGHGMTLDEIEEKWMEPATTDKSERTTSRKGRKLLGSKGIGRFAAAKLGRWLELRSTSLTVDEQSQTTRVPSIDWDIFESTKYLADVTFSYETSTAPSALGTELIIRGLREKWNRSKLQRLHQELRRMISPLEETEDEPDFQVLLDLSECTNESCGFDGPEIVNGPLSERAGEGPLHRVRPFPLLKSCDYEVDGAFDNDGHFSGKMTIHRGELEPQSIELFIPLLDEWGEAPCGQVLVHLFIFDREAHALQSAMQRAGMGQLSAPKARELLNNISGVAIYRDRFRIRPYGDPDNDWLTLDTRRVQAPTIKIGHNQISGVLVVDTAQRSGLVERSSREGLEENGSFRRLRRLVETLLAEKVEPIRYAFREKADIGRNKSRGFARVYQSTQLSWIKPFVDALPDAMRPEAEEVVAAESRRLTRLINELEEAQAILETKVTLGLILGEVLHEGKAPVAFIQDEARRLSRWWPSIFDETKAALEYRTQTPGILRGMTINAQRLRDLFRATEPLAGGKRGSARQYNPVQVVVDTLNLFRSKCEGLGIAVHRKAAPDVDDVSGYREDLSTAVTNLVDNAIYWLEYHGVEQPEITATISTQSGSCIVTISDNGIGIPVEFREHIFDVGFTLKPNGTGLGLSIAREAIGRSGGTIKLLDETDGTSFQIMLPTGGV